MKQFNPRVQSRPLIATPGLRYTELAQHVLYQQDSSDIIVSIVSTVSAVSAREISEADNEPKHGPFT
jgi:hypothetical protein